MSSFQVKKVAVLGAGVMGAQIAAHLVNVKVPVVLFDLAAKEGPKNGIVSKAVEGLKKLKPSPPGRSRRRCAHRASQLRRALGTATRL
jgi:3-hydroxyacyl-CoA dehydrogenase